MEDNGRFCWWWRLFFRCKCLLSSDESVVLDIRADLGRL